MQNECRLSIITVNYNGLDDTCELLETIPLISGIEVIVVDNGSHHDEAAIIHSRYPFVTAIRSEKNLGFAGGNNLGIRSAHGRDLFFVNNDTLFCKEKNSDKKEEVVKAIDALINRLDSADDIGMVCPKIRFSWDDSPIQFTGYTPLSRITLRNASIGFGEPDHGQYDTPHPTPYAHGAAMLAKREAVERAGLMPECYFLYYEELDWSLMFARSGYSIWYDPNFTIFHKESRTTGQGSPLRCYYISRNRLLFTRRNVGYPLCLLTYVYLLLVVVPRDMLMHLIHGRFAHAISTLRGVLHFLRGKEGKWPE